MLKRIGEAIRRNKEDIKTVIIGLLVVLLVPMIIFNIMLIAITQDLVQRVKDQEYAMQEMLIDLESQGNTISYFNDLGELCFGQGYIEEEEYKITCEYKDVD